LFGYNFKVYCSGSKLEKKISTGGCSTELKNFESETTQVLNEVEKTPKIQDFLENIFVKAMCHDLRRKLTMHNYSMHNNQQIIKEFIVKNTNKIILMRNSSISNWTPIKVTITKDTIKV
jgi:hypothetical protein